MRPQAGRDKLLHAGATLLRERGYHATSISEIARAAGVSKGLTYNYFDSKQDLLVAILEHTTDEMVAMSTPADVCEHTHRTRLAQLLQRFEASLIQNQCHLTFELGLLFQPDLRPIALGPIQRRAARLLVATEQLFTDADFAHPRQTARRFLSELDGIALHYLGVFPDYPLKTMLNRVLHNYQECPE